MTPGVHGQTLSKLYDILENKLFFIASHNGKLFCIKLSVEVCVLAIHISNQICLYCILNTRAFLLSVYTESMKAFWLKQITLCSLYMETSRFRYN